LYAPIIDNVGFSHPLTFAIITLHNTFSFSYLLFAVAIAYPAFHEKTWLIPAAITAVWVMISISIIVTLDTSVTTVIALILPHGWLEFAAIAYWTNSLRKATQNNDLFEPINTPSLKDYLRALVKPRKFITLAKTDIQILFKTTKLSFKTLSKNLKKAYLKMLLLIVIAALIETYITPIVFSLIKSL